MDAAEAWLREHDPEYAERSHGWRFLDGEECLTPSQEAPWDEVNHGAIDTLLPEFRLIGPVHRRLCERASCGELFVPTTGRQRFCTVRCKAAVEQRRRRHRRRWQV